MTIPDLTFPVKLSDLQVYASLLADAKNGGIELVEVSGQEAKECEPSFLTRLAWLCGKRRESSKPEQETAYSRLALLSEVAEKATAHWMMAETLSLLNQSPDDIAQYKVLEAEILVSHARRQEASGVLAHVKAARKAVNVALAYCTECVSRPAKYEAHIIFHLNTRDQSETSSRGFLNNGLLALAKCQRDLRELDAHLFSLRQNNDLNKVSDPLTQAVFYDVSPVVLANNKMQGLNVHGGFARMERHFVYYQDTLSKLNALIRLLKNVLHSYDTNLTQRAERSALFSRYFDKARTQLPDELMAFAVLPAGHGISSSFIKK
ncbi:TPA: hypothetical protein ACSCYS_004248 [Aeromonas veronii]